MLERRTLLLLGAGSLALGGGAAFSRGPTAAGAPDLDLVRREYLAGDVVDVDGWVVARSERDWLIAAGVLEGR